MDSITQLEFDFDDDIPEEVRMLVGDVEIRSIENWPGYYVTIDGRVISTRLLKRNVQAHVMRGCIRNTGYPYMTLNNQGKRRQVPLHRLVLEAFRGQPLLGQQACHNDGNPLNNHLDNLRWDSGSANSYDALEHGTHQGMRNFGENNGTSRLTDQQVREIKRRLIQGERNADLAREYAIAPSVISNIRNGKAWSHVQC